MKRTGLIALALCALAYPSPATAHTYVGAQLLVGQFSHTEAISVENLKFTGIGGLLEFWYRKPRFEVHVEGIPTFSPPRLSTTVGSSDRFAAVGTFDAVFHVALDPRGRLWAGGGVGGFDDKIRGVPIPPFLPPETATSHLTGVRYELRAVLPAGDKNFVDLQLADMPDMRGSIHFQFDNPLIVVPDRSTSATAVSTLAAYGWKRQNNEYLIGWRSVNYPVNFAPSGQFAFRNVISALFFETRVYIGP